MNRKQSTKSTVKGKAAVTVDARDLPALISATLLHPDLPTSLHNYFWEGMLELFNDLPKAKKDALEASPARVAQLLAFHAEAEDGGAK
ncbi:MAG: hypothetical protein QOJ70_1109 [Acidobacteriota bacterium]|jgi:hypothetical protein|nr:hypothetical protein [Acidobacteriota bacterium]